MLLQGAGDVQVALETFLQPAGDVQVTLDAFLQLAGGVQVTWDVFLQPAAQKKPPHAKKMLRKCTNFGKDFVDYARAYIYLYTSHCVCVLAGFFTPPSLSSKRRKKLSLLSLTELFTQDINFIQKTEQR